VLDAGYLAARKYTTHGLVEFDVTEPRRVLREQAARTGEALSFTAFLIACLGRAVSENRLVQASRTWRNRLIVFDDVDVATLVEGEAKGHKVPLVRVIRRADQRDVREIHDEIRSFQSGYAASEEVRRVRWFVLLPGPLRRLFYRAAGRFPHLGKRVAGTVVLTSVGMFGAGGGWGISPLGHYPLGVTVGGLVEKPVVIDGQVQIREHLSVTVSFDHTIVDGAPAARFVQRFKQLVESGFGLTG
jgi:pyruvate/2-oxoglutarate dehydrogenase complex dihydrolipoamide acyltransferase (E2) component